MKYKWVKMYMDIANRIADESHSKRNKVGAVFVSKNGVMSIGINGLPPGGSNNCEDANGDTKVEVSHAEEAVLTKLLKQGVSTEGGFLFCTLSPCINCMKLLSNAGIKTIWFRDMYRDTEKPFKYAKLFGVELIEFKG